MVHLTTSVANITNIGLTDRTVDEQWIGSDAAGNCRSLFCCTAPECLEWLRNTTETSVTVAGIRNMTRSCAAFLQKQQQQLRYALDSDIVWAAGSLYLVKGAVADAYNISTNLVGGQRKGNAMSDNLRLDVCSKEGNKPVRWTWQREMNAEMRFLITSCSSVVQCEQVTWPFTF